MVVAFAQIQGNNPVTLVGDQFIGYTNNEKMTDDYDEIIRDDITTAKKNYGLKYVLASVGGENNTFSPAGGDTQTMAQNTIAFLKKYNFDGIDFDLEVIPGGYSAKNLASFIKALKALKADIVISSAPQVNNVGGKLAYVNTGVEQVYNAAIAQGLFDIILVQEYNTGGNYVDVNGNLCGGAQSGCYDETSAEFIVNSFMALKKITPGNTLIVPGQPATKDSAGTATVFNGKDANNVYGAMAKSYSQLINDPQFGGAMTWDTGHDYDNQYNFVKTILPAIQKNNV